MFSLQLICEFLALKNDISSWRKKKSMVGMSRKLGEEMLSNYITLIDLCCRTHTHNHEHPHFSLFAGNAIHCSIAATGGCFHGRVHCLPMTKDNYDKDSNYNGISTGTQVVERHVVFLNDFHF